MLRLALLAAALSAAAAQPDTRGGSTTSGAAKTLSKAQAASELASLGRPLQCVLVITDSSLGTFMGRISAGTPSASAAAALMVGQSVTVSGADLEGPVPWLLYSYGRGRVRPALRRRSFALATKYFSAAEIS